MVAGAQAWDQQGAFRVLRQDTNLLSSRWRCGLHIQTQWQSTATCQTTPRSLAAGMLNSNVTFRDCCRCTALQDITNGLNRHAEVQVS